jgi:hypothetical protein
MRKMQELAEQLIRRHPEAYKEFLARSKRYEDRA